MDQRASAPAIFVFLAVPEGEAPKAAAAVLLGRVVTGKLGGLASMPRLDQTLMVLAAAAAAVMGAFRLLEAQPTLMVSEARVARAGLAPPA